MTTELERMNLLRLSNAQANQITRDCLKRAMGRLLREKDFQKITITELVTVAGVSRTAFYRNYDSKEALLEDVNTAILKALSDSIIALKNAGSPDEKRERMEAIFKELRDDHLDLVWLIDIGRSLLSHEQIEAIVAGDQDELKYLNVACVSAILGVITRWLKTGMNESPEEMSRLTCDYLARMRGRA